MNDNLFLLRLKIENKLEKQIILYLTANEHVLFCIIYVCTSSYNTLVRVDLYYLSTSRHDKSINENVSTCVLPVKRYKKKKRSIDRPEILIRFRSIISWLMPPTHLRSDCV